MVLAKTHGMDMDLWYLISLYSIGTPESHSYERPSVARMRDFFTLGYTIWDEDMFQ